MLQDCTYSGEIVEFRQVYAIIYIFAYTKTHKP